MPRLKSNEEKSAEDAAHALPNFGKKDVQAGPVLGVGSFGIVHEVRGLRLKKGECDEPDIPLGPTNAEKAMYRTVYGQVEPLHASKRYLSQHCLRLHTGDSRYAIKSTLDSIANSEDRLQREQAIMDMATEAKILSGLRHPNVCALRAVADTPPTEPGYFLILDRLYDTLDVRMNRWRKEDRKASRGLLKSKKQKASKRLGLLADRIEAAVHLGDALAHVHRKCVVFRDLKPENVGFDLRDELKLFDFGLARDLRALPADDDGTFELTSMTGSARFMAPEVANYKPYNESCDVYSFSILLWQMYSLPDEAPFEEYDLDTLANEVWNRPHVRPDIPDEWPESIQTLLKRSWSPMHTLRPSMNSVVDTLRKELRKISKGTSPKVKKALNSKLSSVSSSTHTSQTTVNSMNSWNEQDNEKAALQ